MIQFRDRTMRGTTHTGWLDSRHTFSFGGYHDPAHMGFHALRVINDDRVIPGGGFPTHGHRDMEILTYVLSGALAHQDSLGNGTVIRPGEIQRMSAGTGIRHSEFNASQTEPVHFLQIWIVPSRTGLAPGYQQQALPKGTEGQLQLIGAPSAAPGTITIHQDVQLFRAHLVPGQSVTQALAPGRAAWVHVATGIAAVGATELREGDGAAIAGELEFALSAETESDVLVFDLAAH